MNFKSDFLNFLQERDFIHQGSNLNLLDHLLHTTKVKAYIGFDCTAPSLHVGSLIQILLLKYLQDFGHNPVALLGGGTTLVGDPSGKDKSRVVLSENNIQDNLKGIENVLKKFIKFEGNNPAQIVNNADWLCELNYLNFLREFGSLFTINRMLTFDSVKLRLSRESPLTFLEFNYMLLQAVDFYYLNKNHGIVLQMGGSDQWGNIINGIELVRKISKKEVYGLTTHLVTNSDGSKMGKTADGAIWLDDKLFSSWNFYQYFRNIDDLDVIKYLKLFTTIPLTEIKKLSELKGKDINEAKKILAFELTSLCHGIDTAKHHEKTAINTFEKKNLDTNLPTFFISETDLDNGILLVKLMNETGLTKSNGEGRKLIINSGVKINDEIIKDIAYIVDKKNLVSEVIKLSLGKKKHILIKIN